jgi:hypothetical protein
VISDGSPARAEDLYREQWEARAALREALGGEGAVPPGGLAAGIRKLAEQRDRLTAAAQEWCRRCRDLDLTPLQPAVVILWGKLLPPEHLGPRCEEHAAEAIGWDALRRDQFEQWAGFDLRPFRTVARATRPRRWDTGEPLTFGSVGD